MTTHASDVDIDTGASYGTYKSYVVGFVLSILITLLSFYLVSFGVFPPKTLYITIGLLALVQFFVQTVFFLHLNSRSNASWNLVSFLFTFLMVSVLVVGTMWIMYNLYEKMGMNAMAM
jgi:cytochrome o ubiquinol oxidase subunit IV